ncbi:MAG: hypothetical protein RJA10_4177 [Pseudomonadota bacterium]|jgi:hypothetical protein
MPSSTFRSGELLAFAELSKARRQLVVNMFTGTELKFGKAAMASNAKGALQSGKSLASSVKKVKDGTSMATKAASVPGIKEACENFIQQCADIDDIGDVVAAIGGEAFKELLAEVTPVLGIVYSAGKLVIATKKVVEDGRNLYKHAERKEGFRPGDPAAACDAVKLLIQRDLAKHSVDLARQATTTGGKIAGVCVDLGTGTNAALGTASALAGLGLRLFQLGIDIKDMRAGNARLRKPDTIDHTVFAECPILGCYLLTCADTSSVANLFIGDIGLPGWMDRVETMKKEKMDPLLKVASKAINRSNLQLDGLQANKGTFVKKGFFASVKANAVKSVIG